jgi:serine/threonine protein kinase
MSAFVANMPFRDIKLENLFISNSGHLQLGDFGLAISVLEERPISPVGTLEYMSPEILRYVSAYVCCCMPAAAAEHTDSGLAQQHVSTVATF